MQTSQNMFDISKPIHAQIVLGQTSTKPVVLVI